MKPELARSTPISEVMITTFIFERCSVLIGKMKLQCYSSRSIYPILSHILSIEPVVLTKDLSYIEESIHILVLMNQVLHIRTIPLVKVLWRNHSLEEATWEDEESMKRDYPYLFD